MSQDTSSTTPVNGPVADDEAPDLWDGYSDAELIDLHHKADDMIAQAKVQKDTIRASLLVRLRELANKSKVDKVKVDGPTGAVRLDAATSWSPVITDPDAAAAYFLGRDDAKAAVLTQITVPGEVADRALAALRMGLGPGVEVKVGTLIDERLLSVWRKHVNVWPDGPVGEDTESLPASRTNVQYLNTETGELDGDVPGIGAKRKASRIVVPQRTTPTDQPDTSLTDRLEEQQ